MNAVTNGLNIASPSMNGGDVMLRDVNKIPKPDNGFEAPKIVNENGRTLNNPTKEKSGFMAGIDNTMSKPSGLSVGMTVALAVCPMALTIILAIIGYLMLFTGDGATVRTKVEALNEKMEMYQKMNVAQAEATAKLLDEIKSDVKEMNRGYQDMREFKAKMEGVKAGVLAGSK